MVRLLLVLMALWVTMEGVLSLEGQQAKACHEVTWCAPNTK